MCPRTDRDAVAHPVPGHPNRRHAIASTPEGHGRRRKYPRPRRLPPATRPSAGPSVGAGHTARRVRDARNNCGIENGSNAPYGATLRRNRTGRPSKPAGTGQPAGGPVPGPCGMRPINATCQFSRKHHGFASGISCKSRCAPQRRFAIGRSSHGFHCETNFWATAAIREAHFADWERHHDYGTRKVCSQGA